jgi:hypothetical protein
MEAIKIPELENLTIEKGSQQNEEQYVIVNSIASSSELFT